MNRLQELIIRADYSDRVYDWLCSISRALLRRTKIGRGLLRFFSE